MLMKILFMILETVLISFTITPPSYRTYDIFIDGFFNNIFYNFYVPISLFTVIILSLWYMVVMVYQSTTTKKFSEWSNLDLIIFPMITTGALLRIYCYKVITSECFKCNDNKVISSGPYSCIRHPLYTGYVMIILGRLYLCWVLHNLIPLWVQKYFWVVLGIDIWFLTFGLYNRVFSEEQILASKFERQWREYSKNKKRFIPYVF
ncbi:hypothetical protein Glove_718g27 [Diversispora epigaea]|uniref:Uncharacterized protein n=1 Tax=Diversispora epigaea TaxID=1348612 RepID=A0A397G0W8_9GLOM|nr:hypothetical protein Glove_718g27 [Diversispora epigaea]